MRALVMEPNVELLVVVARALRRRGHRVTVGIDPVRALAAHRAEPFDLVFASWQLDGIDRLTLCQHVLPVDNPPATTLVFIAQEFTELDVDAVIASGATDILTTPLDSALLMLRIAIAERAVHDARQRSAMRQAVAHAESLTETVFANAPGMLAIKDDQARFVQVNATMARWLGCAHPAHAIGKTEDAFISPNHAVSVAQDDHRVLETGKPVRNKFECQVDSANPAGNRWAQVSKVAIPGPDQRPMGMLMTALDVTELLAAEDTFQTSQAQIRAILDAVDTGVVVQYATGGIQASNNAAQRILGLTRTQLLSRDSVDPRWRAIFPDGRPWPGDSHPATVSLQTGAPLDDVRMGIHQPDGTLTWVDLTTRPLVHPGETAPYAVIVHIVDVTERVAADAARHGPQYAELADAAPGVMLTLDAQGRVRYANAAATAKLAFGDTAIVGRGLLELVHPDDRVLARSRIPELGQGRPTIDLEPFVLRLGNHGEWRPYTVVARPTVGRTDELGMLVWAYPLDDVQTDGDTDTRELMPVTGLPDHLVHDYDRSWQFVDHMPGVVYAYGGADVDDARRQMLYVGPQLRTLFGFDPSAWLADPDLIHCYVHPDDRALAVPPHAFGQNGERGYALEYRVITPDDRIVWVADDMTLVADVEAGTTYWQGFLRDITDQKLRDESLRVREREYREVVEFGPTAIFRHEPDGTIRWINAAASDALGYGQDELIGQNVSVFIRPEETPRKQSSDWIRQEIGGDIAVIPVTTRDGDARFWACRSLPNTRPKTDEPGTTVCAHDITEQICAEHALRESEHRIQRLAAAADTQSRELDLLAHVRQAIAHDLDLPVIVRQVVEAVAATFGYSLVSLYLYAPQSAELTLRHQVGYQPEWILDPIWDTQGVAGRVVRTGLPELVSDVTRDPDYIVASPDVRSLVVVPLRNDHETCGVMILESAAEELLTGDDLRLMTATAELVNNALARARLYTEARTNEERYRTVVERAQEIIFQTDADGTWTYLNPAWETITGFDTTLMLGRPVLEFVHPEDQHIVQSLTAMVRHGHEPDRPFEVRMRTTDRAYRWLEIRARPTEVATTSDHDRPPTVSAKPRGGGISGTMSDITDRRAGEVALRESDARFRSAFDHAAIGMGLVSPEGRWIQVNHAVEAMLGYSGDELRATSALALTHPDDVSAELAGLRRLLAGEIGFFRAEKRYLHRDGQAIWAMINVSLVRSQTNAPRYFIVQIEDISERKKLEARLRYLAHHDPVSGLPNRPAFIERLEQALSPVASGNGAIPAGASRAQTSGLAGDDDPSVAVIFLDLDGFKAVNDTRGHDAGDHLLAAVGQRFSRALRGMGTVARYGGDEFTVLLDPVSGKDAALATAERLLASLEAPIEIDGVRLRLHASAGLALGRPGVEPAYLLQQADAALYRAKGTGRGLASVYDPAIDQVRRP